MKWTREKRAQTVNPICTCEKKNIVENEENIQLKNYTFTNLSPPCPLLTNPPSRFIIQRYIISASDRGHHRETRL